MEILSCLVLITLWTGIIYIPLVGSIKNTGVLKRRSQELFTPTLIDYVANHRAPIEAKLNDGLYLYSESQKAEEIGKEYIVFELKEGKVVGALYLPRSAFYCFFGTLKGDRLDVTVIDSFEKKTYPYNVSLLKYYQLHLITDNDRRILNECKYNR